jgi:hypothetical protein
MFPNQNAHAFTEFYEGVSDIQSNYDNNDGFGKMTSFSQSSKGFKKVSSVQSFGLVKAHNGYIKKTSSTNTFTEMEFDPISFSGKPVINYVFNDESTKESYSPYSSKTSLSSISSVPTMSQAKGKKTLGKKKNASELEFRNKYKTEVCKYWAEKGYCEFGDQCAFAHGGNDMRQKTTVASNYKTKQCVQYHENGLCPYGIRCQFLHCLRKDCQSNPKLLYTSYAEDVENVEIWFTENPDCVCLRRRNRPRLPALEKATLPETSVHDSHKGIFN